RRGQQVLKPRSNGLVHFIETLAMYSQQPSIEHFSAGFFDPFFGKDVHGLVQLKWERKAHNVISRLSGLLGQSTISIRVSGAESGRGAQKGEFFHPLQGA